MSINFQDHLKDGVYVSPHNGKTFPNKSAFSAHMRNLRFKNIGQSRIALCSCRFCQFETTIANIIRHADACYLNPKNIAPCEICSKPIKKYKANATCSTSCANTKFRTGIDNPNWKDDSYRTTCFHYHEKKCVVCDERKIVAVHHLDENHHNNEPSNLIPLCPTHHQYWHSQHKGDIEDLVWTYIAAWKLTRK